MITVGIIFNDTITMGRVIETDTRNESMQKRSRKDAAFNKSNTYNFLTKKETLFFNMGRDYKGVIPKQWNNRGKRACHRQVRV